MTALGGARNLHPDMSGLRFLRSIRLVLGFLTTINRVALNAALIYVVFRYYKDFDRIFPFLSERGEKSCWRSPDRYRDRRRFLSRFR